MRQVLMSTEFRPASSVPKVNTWFEVKIDGTADPAEIIRGAGCDPRRWRYLSPPNVPKGPCATMLTRFGWIPNLIAGRQNAYQLGGYKLLEAQAVRSFVEKYPRPDREGPIVFGGSILVPMHEDPRVICLTELNGRWDMYLAWATESFGGEYRWALRSS